MLNHNFECFEPMFFDVIVTDVLSPYKPKETVADVIAIMFYNG